MTAENRHFITVDEITHIECQCKNKRCGVSILIPIGDKEFMSHLCPHCKQLWFQQESSIDKAIIDLKKSLAVLNAESAAMGFTLRLQIKSDDAVRGGTK